MRELVISKILEYTEGGQYLDEYDTSVDEVNKMTNEELLDLFQEMVFGG